MTAGLDGDGLRRQQMTSRCRSTRSGSLGQKRYQRGIARSESGMETGYCGPTSFGAQRTRLALIAAGIVMALGLGWIGAWSSHRLPPARNPAPLAQKPDSSSRRSAPSTRRSGSTRCGASSRGTSRGTARSQDRPCPRNETCRSPERAQSAAQTAAASTKPVSSSPAPHTSILARPAAVAQQQAKLEPQRSSGTGDETYDHRGLDGARGSG